VLREPIPRPDGGVALQRGARHATLAFGNALVRDGDGVGVGVVHLTDTPLRCGDWPRAPQSLTSRRSKTVRITSRRRLGPEAGAMPARSGPGLDEDAARASGRRDRIASSIGRGARRLLGDGAHQVKNVAQGNAPALAKK
jgi:hypothetical protein